MVRLGIMAFIIRVVFDVVVAWALYQLYKQNILSGLSILFRMMHAAIMGVAVFTLPVALTLTNEQAILNQIDIFNTIGLIGLFFFGIHLILLGRILQKPKLITISLIVAGVMYMVDTGAHFLLPNYNDYNAVFLAMVSISNIFGEMALSVWLLVKGGKG